MEWEPTAAAMAFQFYVGEPLYQGAATLGGNGIKSPAVIPGNFWSEPERFGTEFWWRTHACEMRASLRLYADQRDASSELPELNQVDARAILQIGTWRSTTVYYDSAAPTVERRAEISWSEFEVPFLPARAQISWAEFEVPNALRRAEVSWSEFEIPDAPAPRRAEISWSEFEVPFVSARAQVSWAEFEVPLVGEGGIGYYSTRGRRRRR